MCSERKLGKLLELGAAIFTSGTCSIGVGSPTRPLSAGRFTDPTKRDSIQAELTKLGRGIAAEWSKPNSCRKIDTKLLEQWYADLKDAASRDSGDGTEINREIGVISQKVGSD